MPQAFQAGLQFSTDEILLEKGITSTSFDFAYLKDLWVRINVPHLTNLANTHVTFQNPIGELVQEHGAHFSPEANLKAMAMPGVDHPVAVFHPKLINGGFAVDQAIPVGGAAMMRSPMPGTWLVTAKVDDQLYTAEIQVSVTP